MKAPDDKKSMSLSLRLLRDGKGVDDALREGHTLEETPAKTGRLFTEQTPANSPPWLKFIGEFADAPLARLETKSCAALLFLEVTLDTKGAKPRTMVLAFGTGHHSLNLNAFERNFGLRVALNSVTRANLRNLDVATLDATTFQKRIQASRNADLQGFGIDVQRDLLRLAGGVPTDTSFARSLAGKDALTLNTKTSPDDVLAKCRKALQLFGEDYYKKDYRWIDFVAPVREQDRVNHLDNLAFFEVQELLKGNPSDLHIALPDIISPDDDHQIGYFGLGFKSGTKPTFAELAIEDYIAQLVAGRPDEVPDMAALKASHEVRVVVNGEGDKKQRRHLYDCFVYEVVDQGNTYVLFSGEWYRVDKDFYAEVEKDFLDLVSANPFLASTTAANERALILDLDANPDLLNLDQVKLSPAGAGGANLEPCDFLSRTKQFIHLKDGHASAPISHLWNQGVVSAESFVRDETFRKGLRREAIKRQKKYKKKGFETLLPDGRSKPTPSDYTVVFGVMRGRHKKTKDLSLPFFSKVSLRAVADRIRLMGYPVEVHLIEKL